MNNSRDVIIELIQKETFKQLQDLFPSSQVNRNSKLVTLNPTWDNNIIKVEGLLKNIIDIPNNIKHQIILPRHHPVTDLLILHYHKSNHHYGRDQTLALLRERYWTVKAKSIIHKVLSTCLLCKHNRSIPKPQLMWNLPKERIAAFKPTFTITGVDCFGPVTIKQYKRTRTSNNKQIKILSSCIYLPHNKSCTFRAFNRYHNRQLLNDIAAIHSLERWAWYNLVRQWIKLCRCRKKTKANSTKH